MKQQSRKWYLRRWNVGLLAILLGVTCGCGDSGEAKLTKRARIEGAIEQEWAATHDLKTLTVPRERLVKARAELQGLLAQGRSVNDLQWTERGPTGVGGRTRALLFDRNDPTGESVWAGGVAGGLWRTSQISSEDPQWVKSDDFFENLAVSCIAQDPAHPDTLFFGTGEGWFNHDAVRGLGIWRSTNGGQSWEQLPSTATPDFYYVMSLAFDASGRLLATTRDAGLLRSDDAGETWTVILSPQQGGAPHQAAADIEVASNGDVYVTFGMYRLTGAVFVSRYDLHGPATGNPGTWENITPFGDWERIELTSAPSDPDRLYLLAQGAGTTKVTGMFRSFDAGTNWEALPDIPVQVGQAWYNLIAAVDPLDADLWFLGAIRLYRSDDAGQSWEQLTPIHPDHHAISFDPLAPGRAILGNDGGVYLCPDLSVPSPQLLDRNQGYNITQFYGAAIHPDPASGSDVIFGGTQDNGTLRLTAPGMNGKDQLLQGDGGLSYFDALDPDLQIGSILYNRYVVTTDNWATFTSVNHGFSGRFINPSDYDSQTKTLFSGDDGGMYRRWPDIDVCQSASCSDVVSVAAFDTAEVTTVSLDPHRPGTVYFGLRNGRVVRVADAGTTVEPAGEWLNAGSGMPEGWVSAIAADPLDSAHLVVTMSNYGLPGVWETTNGGQSWADIETNLPDLPVRHAVFQPNQSQRLMLATDLGVWMTNQLNGAGTVWMPAGDGLANKRVDHLHFRDADHLLVAATHGRGIFTTNYFRRPSLSFSTPYLSVNEASPVSVALPCSDSAFSINPFVTAVPAPQDTVEVTVVVVPGGTATSGRDFILTDSVLRFGPGLPETQAISLQIVQDGVLEGGESVRFELQWPDSALAVPGLFQQLDVEIVDDEWLPDTVALQVDVEIGGGNDVLSGVPLGNEWEDSRVQVLYLASELTGLGLQPGLVREIGVNVAQANGLGWFQNVSIRLKNSFLNEVGPGFENGLTEVYSGAVQLAEGWNMVVLDEPFYWDGSNLMVEWCADNPAGIGTADDIFTGSETGFPSVALFASSGLSGCPLVVPDGQGSVRPNLRIIGNQEIRVSEQVGEVRSVQLDEGEEAHLTDAQGQLLASLKASGAGCYTVRLVRTGTDTIVPLLLSPEAVYKTSLSVETDSDQSYDLTLYANGQSWQSRPAGVNPLFFLRTDTLAELEGPGSPEVYPILEIDSFGMAPVYKFQAEVSGAGIFALATGLPGPLAVEEINLSGKLSDGKAKLDWSISGRVDADQWLVERSDGSTGFTVLDTLEGAGLSRWTWKGDHPAGPHPFWYYRVSALSGGDRTLTSEIIALAVAQDEGVRLFPLPASDAVTVCVPKEWLSSGLVQGHIFNMTGRIVGEWQFSSNCSQVPVGHLEDGIYMVQISSGTNLVRTLKMVVAGL
jgi:photosystem II stability/assembly factor-like uncharacterized protein